ncbi:ISL3 family transposase [Arthrobacter sp. 92]|uniref:ISL3 family transposase n=1 Tax=Arthrobacter sp. 92 TaxID=3418175 RepID=UPI003D085B7B
MDLVPGRSAKAYADWLKDRGTGFTAGIKTAALDPFRGYVNAIRDELPEAITVLDAFHVVKLGSAMVDEVRRRVQQDTLGHRGRKEARSTASAGTCRSAPKTSPTSRQAALTRNSPAGIRTTKSRWPGSATRSSAPSTTQGRNTAGNVTEVIASFPAWPIPEVARLGRTLKQLSQALARWPSGRAASWIQKTTLKVRAAMLTQA